MVDKYKSDYDKGLKDLDGQVKILNEFYDYAKDGIQEANQKIIDYQPEDPMDRITFEKVNNLNNLSTKIIDKFKNVDIVNMNKLQM